MAEWGPQRSWFLFTDHGNHVDSTSRYAEFRKEYRLGIISDAQRLCCKPELRTLRIEDFFDATVISSDYGFRKPDPRLFHIALAALNVHPHETVYIGNKYETVLVGAREAGLAVAVLINQNEEDKQRHGEVSEPDFIVENLSAALRELRTRDGGETGPEKKPEKPMTRDKARG